MMKYLYEKRNTKPGELGIVIFILRGPWWRVHVGQARSVNGWFCTIQVGRLRLNLERRTPMGFAADDVASVIVRDLSGTKG